MFSLVQKQSVQHLLILAKCSAGWSTAAVYVDFFNFCANETILRIRYYFPQGLFSSSRLCDQVRLVFDPYATTLIMGVGLGPSGSGPKATHNQADSNFLPTV